MGSKIQLAYKAYSAVAKTALGDATLLRFRAHYQNKPGKLHRSAVEAAFGSVGTVQPEEIRLQRFSLASENADGLLFDALGTVTRQQLDCGLPSALHEVLSSVPNSPEDGPAVFHVCVCPDAGTSIWLGESSLCVMGSDSPVLFESGQRSVLILTVDAREGYSDHLPAETVLQLAYAQQNRIDFVMAYVLRAENDLSVSEKQFADLVNRLTQLGANAVWGAGPNPLASGSSVKRWDGTMAFCFASLGETSGPGAALRYRVKFLEMPIAKAGIIPLLFGASPDGLVTRLEPADDSGKENADELLDAFEAVQSASGTYRVWEDVLTIGELCGLAGETLPESLSHLAHMGIGRISTRHYDVQPGDVFFFLESYAEANDNPAPDEVRKLRVDEALAHGATFVVSFVRLASCHPALQVPSCRETHVAVCKALRARLACVQAIGITGSIGKTSTKDMLACVMAQGFRAFSNDRNANVQVNIGKNIQLLSRATQMYIQECSGSRPGDAFRHADMIAPSAVVVTNVGLAHIGNFRDQADLCAHKFSVKDALVDGGVIYLNADDPLLWEAAQTMDGSRYSCITYAISNHEADYFADDIHPDQSGTTFTIVHGSEHFEARLNVLGRHNVLNAVCCYAVAKRFGLADGLIAAGLAAYRPSGIRQNLVRLDGVDLFIDCFNSSIGSVDSSLSVLDDAQVTGKKIAVLGDITGTGQMAGEVHHEVGRVVTGHHADELIFFGPNMRIAFDDAKGAGLPAWHTADRAQLTDHLRETICPGDFVLFKGSSKMRLADIVDDLFATCFADQVHLDKGDFRTVEQDGVRYYVFPQYASAAEPIDRHAVALTIASHISGKPVYSIADGAFSGMPDLVSVALSDTVRYIGSRSFAACPKMTTPAGIAGVRRVASDAFDEVTC